MSLERSWSQGRLVVPGKIAARLVGDSVLVHLVSGIRSKVGSSGLRDWLSLDSLGMPIQHHLSGQRSDGRDVPLQLPGTPLPSFPLRRFTTSDTVQAVEVHDRSENTSVKRAGGFVKVGTAKESNQALDDFCQEHEEEEDECDGLKEEYGVCDPRIGRVDHSKL